MRFRLLGRVTVEHADQVLPLPGGRERCVLCLLLLAESRPVPVERLIDTIWPDSPPAGAPAAIVTYVSRLRSALSKADTGIHAALGRRGGCYVLEVEPETVDIRRFKQLLDLARQTDDSARRSAFLVEGLDLWRGPVAADVAPHDLRERIVGRLDDLRLTALKLRIDADLDLGRHHELVDELLALTGEFPFDEDLTRQAMVALSRCGRRADALSLCRKAREHVVEEFGIDLGDAVRDLEVAVLRGDPALEVPKTLGHNAPEHIPAQLPAAIADFVGRKELLDVLDGLLPAAHDTAPRTAVISAIGGTGGVGKTAVALQWAHSVAHRFDDGQLYVDMRGWSAQRPLSPLDAVAGFLSALGTPARQIPPVLDQAISMYRSKVAGKRLLMVIDNVAHADDVRHLIPGTPGSMVLVTSRARLAGLIITHGARLLDVDVLPPQDAVRLLGSVLAAQGADIDEAAAHELALLCGRLPLALRIAAANLLSRKGADVAGYVAQLRAESRLEWLAVENDPGVSVAATLRLSYDRISADARRLLRWLAIVPATDVTGDGAAAVLDSPQRRAAGSVSELVNAFLLHEHRPGRYALHDLVRAFAAEVSTKEDPPNVHLEAQRRWYRWLTAMSDACARLTWPTYEPLPTPADATPTAVGISDAAAANAWLDAERPNLVGAACRAADDEGFRRVAWQLTHILRGHFWLRRDLVGWHALAHAGLAAARAATDLYGEATSHMSIGTWHAVQDQHQEAITHLSAAVSLSRRAGWVAGEASALSNLGMLYWQAGQLDDARRHLERALRYYRRFNQRTGESAVLTKLGTVHSAAGRLEQAAGCYERALALDADTGSQIARAHNSNNLGNVYHALGELDAALSHFETALRIALANDDKPLQGNVRDSLAATLCSCRRLPEALEQANAALALSREVGDRRNQAHVLNTLGDIHLKLGDGWAALAHFQQAHELATETGTGDAKTGALVGLAKAHTHTGQAREALAFGDQAVKLARDAGYTFLAGQAGAALAGARLAMGDVELAITHAREAISVYEATGHRVAMAEALRILHSCDPDRR